MISYLHEIMSNNNIINVLDIGAGQGIESLYCASFGSHVDWLDKKEPLKYLTKHPLINILKSRIEDFEFNKKYDLIILKFVMPFLEEEFIIKNLFPSVIKSLNNNGYLLINGFCKKDDDLVLPKTTRFFTKEDLGRYLSPLILKDYNEYNKWYITKKLEKCAHTVQIAVFQNQF